MSQTLFTLGETLAVFLATDAASPADALEYRRTVAGSEANVAAASARLGHDAILVTRVGDDSLGESVTRQLDEWRIGANVIRDTRPTGVLVRGAHGVGAMNLRQGSAATALSAGDVEDAWRANIDAVFVTGITATRSASARAAVERTVELARGDGALVVADPNYRPSLGSTEEFAAALSGLRGRIDVAIGDSHELSLLADTSEEDAPHRLLSDGCRAVVMKAGADGVVVLSASGTFRRPSDAAFVRDTVGAGDAFAAGFISGLLDEVSLEECADRGTFVAGRVVETLGDVEGVPRRPDRGRLSSGDAWARTTGESA